MASPAGPRHLPAVVPPDGSTPQQAPYQLTVFALDTCPHCLRAKALLKQNDLYQYMTEISLTRFPERRADMLQLCDRLTVPQVFFGAKHMGGNTELQTLAQKNELLPAFREFASVFANDARLRKPDPAEENASGKALTGQAAIDQKFVASAVEDVMVELGPRGGPTTTSTAGSTASSASFQVPYTQLVRRLRSCLGMKSIRCSGDSVSFTGAKLIQALANKNAVAEIVAGGEDFTESASAAKNHFPSPEKVADCLLQQRVVYDLLRPAPAAQAQQTQTGTTSTENEQNVIPDRRYGLQADRGLVYASRENRDSYVLNTYSTIVSRQEEDGSSAARPSPLAILKRCKKLFDKLKSRHTDPTSALCDYVALAEDREFDLFRLAISGLQEINIVDDFLSQHGEQGAAAAQKAFWINCYNLLVVHAFAEVGIAQSDLRRLRFFAAVKYQFRIPEVPGSGASTTVPITLSLHEIENGVLRGNRPGAIHFRGPFSDAFLRQYGGPAFLVPTLDHRIHFALNCGARSCPPVKWFSQEAVEEELRIVAMAFVGDGGEHENCRVVKVGSNNYKIELSKIFSWYAGDFNRSPADRGAGGGAENKKTALVRTLKQHCRGEKLALLEEVEVGLAEKGAGVRISYMFYDWSTDSKGNEKHFAPTWKFADFYR
mmetsp:Transcript_4379/g.10715  ORF Transcript_4379/g.10715 Transcript_4379/m.10715 type:complete len:659 (-) Transcript_4379:185-2161(-)|eukprot:g9541.t1